MNRLKRINDSFGYKEGDEAILALVGMLKRCFKGNDLIVRYVGDEFVVLKVSIHEVFLHLAPKGRR
jgi:diguanylate cyclase (GGDEF)-like protein